MPVIGALTGALGGWVLQMLFSAFIISGARAFGIEIQAEQLPGIGAFLGFVGGHFQSTLTSSSFK